MKTVYIETSIVSYLTARPARDLIAAAWQNATSSWWETQRLRFDLYTSELVVEEAEQGDYNAASRRLAVLEQLPHLAITDEVIDLASALIEDGALPHAATGDAIHVALATYHGIDYLLTWNCRHIDNAEMKPLIRAVCIKKGYQYPEICTPLELMGDQDDD
ncbi:MAG: type II toxin-antitoxin system VapC family toxin [Nitrospirae bacterium]|nr:type II toxin-antitoxin system VapC family toxin [Nitrospirota bacterium]